MKFRPREYAYLRKRRDTEQQRQELLMGILASVVANHSMVQRDEPASPDHFMPSELINRQKTVGEFDVSQFRSSLLKFNEPPKP